MPIPKKKEQGRVPPHSTQMSTHWVNRSSQEATWLTLTFPGPAQCVIPWPNVVWACVQLLFGGASLSESGSSTHHNYKSESYPQLGQKGDPEWPTVATPPGHFGNVCDLRTVRLCSACTPLGINAEHSTTGPGLVVETTRCLHRTHTRPDPELAGT